MADEKTNADALHLYLTGAGSVGAAQPYHSLSLGGLQSSTELGLGHDLTNPVAGLRIDFVSFENGIGSGALAVISASEIAWTPPGDIQGAVVTIADGETKNIEGDTESQYIRVTRTSATALSGTATVITHRCLGTAIVGRDATVDGLTIYSGMIFKNESAGEITNLEVWIEADTETRAWIATEAVTADAITDISIQGDENPPAGVSGWTQGTTSGSGLSLGTVAAGASVGLWMRKIVPAAADATPAQVQTVAYEFDWGGDTYAGGASGFYRVFDDDLQLYLLYRGVDTDPDLDAAPWETFIDTDPTEPSGTNVDHETATLAVSHTYYFVLRRQDKYGLISQNLDSWSVEIDGAGDKVETPPSAPDETTLVPIADGAVNVGAYYQKSPDGANAADSWLIYLTSNGVDPDPDLDTPVVVAMEFPGALARLDYDSAEFADGTTIKVIVRTQRTGATDSTNTNILITTTTTDSDTEILPASCWVIKRDGETITRVWTHDANNYIDLIQQTGVFRFVVGGSIVGGIDSGGFFARAGTTSNTPYSSDIVQTDLIEIDGGVLVFAGGAPGSRYRMMEIDGSGNLRVSSVVVEGAYPFAEVNTEHYSWDDPNLDFSGDLLNVIMRITQVDVSTFKNGVLHIKGVVDL